MNTWSSTRTGSGSTNNTMMPDYMYMPSHPLRDDPVWPTNVSELEKSRSKARKDRDLGTTRDKEVVVTLRDDQLGQIIEAISPPKTYQDQPHTSGDKYNGRSSRPSTADAYFPKMQSIPPMNRPSSAAMARTSLYTDFDGTLQDTSRTPTINRSNSYDMLGDRLPASRQVSSLINKENRPPSQQDFPTVHLRKGRIPTPVHFNQRRSSYTWDVPMQDNTSLASSRPRIYRHGLPISTASSDRYGASSGTPITGTVKGRKESTTMGNAYSPGQASRIEQDVLGNRGRAHKDPHEQTQSNFRRIPDAVEIIDVDAIDPSLNEDVPQDTTRLSPVKSSHKSGMSSMDSTGRLERQLFSALGEELGSIGKDIDTTTTNPDLVQRVGDTSAHSEVSGGTSLNPPMGNADTIVKRKRQDTISGERDRSPMTKKEKAGQSGVGGDIEEAVPRLRGD